MKTKDDFLKGCEHDVAYIPVNEVKRLMDEWAEYVLSNENSEEFLKTVLKSNFRKGFEIKVVENPLQQFSGTGLLLLHPDDMIIINGNLKNKK